MDTVMVDYSSEELRSLRTGALPATLVTRLSALLLRLDARGAPIRSPGPTVASATRAAGLREDLRDGKAFPIDGVVHFREADLTSPRESSYRQWAFEGP